MKYINTSKTVPEILKEVSKLDTDEEQIERLKLYKSKSLSYIVNGFYNVDWSDLKIPKYAPSKRPVGATDSTINKSLNRLKAAYVTRIVNKKRSQEHLALVLETVHKDEAQLICNMINGVMPYSIHKRVFKAVYPEFFLDQIEVETI